MEDNQPALQVDPNDVTDIGRRTLQVANELAAASASLDGEIQGLFGSWKGDAAAAYRTGWSEVHDGATKVWDALQDVATRLGVNAAEFRDQEDANSESVSSIRLD